MAHLSARVAQIFRVLYATVSTGMVNSGNLTLDHVRWATRREISPSALSSVGFPEWLGGRPPV